MDFLSAFTPVSHGPDALKRMREIDQCVAQALLQAEVSNLTDALADAKRTMTAMQNAIAAKDEEIRRLKEAFAFRGSLVSSGGYKYENRGDGTPVGAAFCPRCEARDGFLVRVTASSDAAEHQCPECKAIYKDARRYPYPGEE